MSNGPRVVESMLEERKGGRFLETGMMTAATESTEAASAALENRIREVCFFVLFMNGTNRMMIECGVVAY